MYGGGVSDQHPVNTGPNTRFGYCATIDVRTSTTSSIFASCGRILVLVFARGGAGGAYSGMNMVGTKLSRYHLKGLQCSRFLSSLRSVRLPNGGILAATQRRRRRVVVVLVVVG